MGHRLLSARQGAIGARFLSARAGQQGRRIHQLHRNSQGFGPGAQHRQGLGEHVLIDQIAPGFAPVGAAAEGHGLGGGCGLIKQGGIGDRQARELADQGLEIEQGLQAPLGNFGLVGGVSRVPGGVFEHLALDHGRGRRAVVAQANQGAAQLVGARQGSQIGQGLGFAAALGQALRRQVWGQQDVGGHHLGDELLEIGHAQVGEHGLELGLGGADMAGHKGAKHLLTLARGGPGSNTAQLRIRCNLRQGPAPGWRRS